MRKLKSKQTNVINNFYDIKVQGLLEDITSQSHENVLDQSCHVKYQDNYYCTP